jgi:hypothetical protein
MGMIARRIILWLFVLMGLLSCDQWGSIDEAEVRYQNNKEEFHSIYNLVAENIELKDITDTYDPYGDIEFLPRYGAFNERTKSAYENIVSKMTKIGLQRVRIDRVEGEHDREFDFVSFYVFSRGFGGSTQAIVVIHVDENALADNSLLIEKLMLTYVVCRKIDGPQWRVCEQ